MRTPSWCGLLLLVLSVASAVQALSWREWTAIPVGASATTAVTVDTAAARRLASTAGVSLDGTITLLTTLSSGSGSLEGVVASLQGVDLSVVSSAVTAATTSPEGTNPSKKTLDGALTRLDTAVDKVVDSLDRIVQAVDVALINEDLRQKLTNVNNLWDQIKASFPTKMDAVTAQCRATMRSSAGALVDLGATQFVDSATADDKRTIARAVANGMVATVVMRQICSSLSLPDRAHAAAETAQIATYLVRVGKELKDSKLQQGAQGYIDKANSATAPTTSNDQIMSAIDQYLDDGATLFDGLNATLNSDEFRRALNSDRNTASGYGALGVMIAVADRQEVKNLKVLNNTIDATYKVRMGEYVKIDKSVDFWHGEKMTQINGMQNLFGDQHEERMGGLNAVNSKVQAVTAQAAQGFNSIQSAVRGMQDDLKNQIYQVAGKVQDDAGETRTYLSREIEAAGQRTVAQITQIDSQVVQGGRAISEALVRTTAVANAEFDATLSSLSSASSAMSKAINGASLQLQSAITSGFDSVRTVVASKIVDAATGLSSDLALVDRKLQFVNGRLEVLCDQLANVDNKMQVVNAMLRALDVSVSDVLSRLRAVLSDITSVLFENDWTTMTRSYDNLRAAYAAVLKNPQSDSPAALFKTSCKQESAYDLFLSFVHVLDVPDSELARQLQKFSNDVAKYEAFGKTVIASLHQLSLLSTTCSALSYNLTTSDLEQKSHEHATLITQVARQFMRQFDEVVPIYMLRFVIAKELESASTEPWGDAATQQLKAQRLRDKLQRSVGDFAQLTVMYAGADAARLNVRHVDAQYDAAATDVATFKRFGVMVSKNAKLAIFWGATPQLAGVDHTTLDRERLLSQGVFRGEINASMPSGCAIAQNASFYPRCDDQCLCAHFENFASPSDPYAGRAITVLNSTDATSDFAVQATEAPLVDYVVEELLVQASGLGASAYGKVEADVLLTRNAARHSTVPLWEAYTDRGRFNVAPSDVKGKLLYANQVTLTLQYERSIRRVLPLFCDNQRHTHSLTEPAVTLTYRCREVAHTRLRDGSGAVVASGVLRSRVDQAVCAVTSATDRQCKAAGQVSDLPSDLQGIEVGRYVSDLTVYGDTGYAGPFAICKGCSSRELAQQLGTTARSFALATPSALELSFLPAACTKRTNSVMVCESTA